VAALPPISEVIDALRTAVLPAAGVAAAVYFVASLLPLVRRGTFPAALAIACGFVAGNWQRDAVEFRLHSDHPLQAKELERSFHAAVTGVNDHGAVVPTARYWLPWIVVAGLLANVVAEMANPLGWLLKLVVAGLGGWLLTPAETQNQHIAYTAGYTALALGIWWVLDDLEAGGLLPFTAALATGAAGVLMLYAGSLRYSDIGVIASSALMGIAVLAWWFRSNVGAVAAVSALGVPGLMLLAQHDTSTQVPAVSFSLMAAAPLALGLMSLPGFARVTGRGRAMLTMLLWLAPAIVSIYLASRVEVLDF
jgi:hypothetical protein